MSPAVIVGLVIGFIVLIIVIVIVVEKKRKEAWQQLASELGITYRKRGNMHNEFGGFKIFYSKGSRHRSKHVCQGDYNGVRLTLGDYTYTTYRRDSDGDRSSSNHTQTILVIQDPELDLPHSFVRRQVRFFDFLGSVFGGQDIDFDEDPEFSKAFVLQGDDEGATAELFGEPELRQAFLEHKKSKLQLEAFDDAIVAHWGKRLSPEDVRVRLQELFELRDALKDAWED